MPGVAPVFTGALHQLSILMERVRSLPYLLASILEIFLHLPLVTLVEQPTL